MEIFYADSKILCNSIKCFLELFCLIAGLALNIIFIVVIQKKRSTKNFKTSKPFRHILIAILISDTWYILNELNIWYFLLTNKPLLTSYNGICQLNSYFNALFTILQEFYMLCANYMLLKIIFPKKDRPKSAEVYNQFLVSKDDDLKNRGSCRSQQNFNLTDLNEIKNEIEHEKTVADDPSNSPNGMQNSFGAKFFSLLSFDFKQVILNKKYIVEEVYYNLIIQEKFLITLNIIIWIYLLSFLIWIQGVQKMNAGGAANHASSSVMESTYHFLEAMYSNQSNKKQQHLRTKSISFDSFEKLSSPHALKLCVVFKFAKPIFKAYSSFLAFLRLFTLITNMLVSMIYHIKFRQLYIDSIMGFFQTNTLSTNANNVKSKNLKSFYLFYTTKNVGKNFAEAAPSGTVSGFTRRAKSMLSHYEHMHFLRYYAKMILFYSLLIGSCIFKESLLRSAEIWQNLKPAVYPRLNERRDMANNTLALIEHYGFLSPLKRSGNEITLESTSNTFIKLLKGFNDDQNSEDTFLKQLTHFSQILAHTTKFLFYLMFSFHLKLFLKYEKKQTKKTEIYV